MGPSEAPHMTEPARLAIDVGQRWPHVFLSYAREDSATAERLRPLLTLAGFGHSPIRRRSQESLSISRLEKAVDGSDFVVAVLSHHR